MKFKYGWFVLSLISILQWFQPDRLSAQNVVTLEIRGLVPGDSATVEIISNQQYYEQRKIVGSEVSSSIMVDLPDGTYVAKFETIGYYYPSSVRFDPSQESFIPVQFEKIDDHGFRYSWRDDDSYAGHATQTNVLEPDSIVILGSVINVPTHSSVIALRQKYGLLLSNEVLEWTEEQAFRLMYTLSEMGEINFQKGENHVAEDGTAINHIIQLSDEHIENDIIIDRTCSIPIVTLASSALTYAVPLVASINGTVGRYFSQRLFKAMVRLYTSDGLDVWKINTFAKENYGFEFLQPGELLEQIMNEDASNFQDFHPDEKLEIISMVQEFPEGLRKQVGIKYLVRRINGQVNPWYPLAPAIAWTGMNTIEYMSMAFNQTPIEQLRRLILHENAHFIWAYILESEFKEEWIALGGWMRDPDNPDQWVTTNTTEFVSAYSHSKNPDEDMAESISFYITNPAVLESRSPAKFKFIQERVMHGSRYYSQIREDLTFQVYNLFPDYTYPGKIIALNLEVTGDAEDDKVVTVEITLKSDSLARGHASMAYGALVSNTGIRTGFYLNPKNGSSDSVLVGTLNMSKYMKNGYWSLIQFVIWDEAGNMRYEKGATVGFKLFINNPLEDLTPPYYNHDMTLSLNHVDEDKKVGNETFVSQVNFKFSVTEKNPMNRALVRVMFPDHSGINARYELDAGASPLSDENPFNPVKFFDFPLNVHEYFPSGVYALSLAYLEDRAHNVSFVFFSDDTSDVHSDNIGLFKDVRQSISVTTPFPDYLKPELDVNSIFIKATPTNPVAPDGETKVDLSIIVKDHSDYPQKASGIRQVVWTLRDPQGKEFSYNSWDTGFQLNFYENVPEEKASDWQRFTFSSLLPKGSAPGKWGLSSIHVLDKAYNWSRYSFEEYIRFDKMDRKIITNNDSDSLFTSELLFVSNTEEKISLEFGLSPIASTGYDDGLDKFAPPIPPSSVLDARFVRAGDDYFIDYQPVRNSNNEWSIKLNPGKNGLPLTVKWNSGSLAKVGDYYIENALTGDVLISDMRDDSTLVITDSKLTQIIIHHRMDTSADSVLRVSFKKGWNLVGLPMMTSQNTGNQIFSSAISNTLYGFEQSYTLSSSMSHGNGYWIRLREDEDVHFTGDKVETVAITLRKGWNLISGTSYPLAASSFIDEHSIIIQGSIFGYDSAYRSVDNLEPGRGYWIRASEEGTVTLGPGSGGVAKVKGQMHPATGDSQHTTTPGTPRELQAHAVLEFGENDGLATRLYFKPPGSEWPLVEPDISETGRLNPVADQTRYQLPPVPPAGLFDARLRGGVYATWEPQAWVEVRQTGKPVSLIFSGSELLQDTAFELIERHGPVELVRRLIKLGDRIELHLKTNELTLSRQTPDQELPEGHQLEQNHPNPFNPSTVIRYALPQATQVRLEVFNVTGQRVAVLADAPMQAGWHEARFDAGGLASGVYVYRLSTSQGFTQSKRLMLVK